MAGKKRNIMAGQSGGLTAVSNAGLAGVFQNAIDLGFDKVYGMLHGIQGLLDGQYVDLASQIRSSLDLEVLKRTPSAFLGSGCTMLPDIHEDRESYEKIFALLNQMDIEVFIYIGGLDSMDTVRKLSDYAVLFGHPQKFIGVLEGIDNNLAVTDHTPGFGSAAKYIAASVKEIIREAEGSNCGCKKVTFLEVSGSRAGWLTGASALAKGEDCEGPDLILLPEVLLDPERFSAKVQEVLEKKDSVVAVVADGIRLSEGRSVSELRAKTNPADEAGYQQTGTAACLADFIAGETDCETEVMAFSALTRAASHMASRTDIDEAFRAGKDAVGAAAAGDNGKMVVLERISKDPYRSRTVLCDVHRITNEENTVPREWMNKEATYVTREFIEYVNPLIQGEVPPIMVNGLPRHLVLTRGYGSRRKNR